MNSAAELEWTYSSDLEVGDYVAISRGANLWSDVDHCTEDEAMFMGLLVGDGCFRGAKNRLGFTNGDEEVRSVYSTLGNNIFGRPPSLVVTKDRCPDLNYHHPDVWEKLTDLGLVNGVLSKDKKIPHSVMSSTKPVVTSFLRGLFEADGGGEGDRCVSYCTKSSQLASQVHTLLLNLGIVSHRRTKMVKYLGGERPFQVI